MPEQKEYHGSICILWAMRIVSRQAILESQYLFAHNGGMLDDIEEIHSRDMPIMMALALLLDSWLKLL